MAGQDKKVFFIGPGYIGLELIDRLLEHNYDITALVRRETEAQKLQKRGVATVSGTIDDKDVITHHVTHSKIVIHTATADHLPSVEAVIAGIDERAKQDKQTIYIHTSGCSFLSDDSKGEYKSDKVYTDREPAAMDALPDTASHRVIDLAIIKARQRFGAKAKLFIMLPPLIYGATSHGRLSIQAITMARFAIKHRYAGHVGKGRSVWAPIHVNDLSYGYLTLLQWLERSPPEVALEHPYFFCENGQEVSWAGLASMIGKELYAAGKVTSPEPREIPPEQYNDLFGKYSVVVIGSNSRNCALRLRELGWTPAHLDVEAAFRDEELPLILKETGEYHGYDRPAASGSG